MKLSAILAPLIAAGVDGETILKTVRAFEDQQENVTEASREKARERWHRWKNKQGTNVSQRLQTEANASKRLTRVEDSSSKIEISGQSENLDTSPSAPSKRGARIPDDFQPDTTWAQGEGLSPSEAQFEASQFLDYWRAKAGKDGCKLDWPGTWRVWVRNAKKRRPSSAPPRQSSPPQRRPNVMDAYEQIARERGWTTDEPEIVPSRDHDVECLPSERGGHSGPVIDLRPGTGWGFGSGNH